MMTLRALEPSDLDALYELENDETVWASSNTHAPYSRYALSQFIATTQNNIYQDGQLRLVASMNKDEMLPFEVTLGMVDLFNFDPQHARAEVGIGLLPSFRGQGKSREVLTLLIDYVRRHLRLHQLYAYVAVDNLPAVKLFRSCDFVECGQLKHWIAKGADSYTDALVLQYIYK